MRFIPAVSRVQIPPLLPRMNPIRIGIVPGRLRRVDFRGFLFSGERRGKLIKSSSRCYKNRDVCTPRAYIDPPPSQKFFETIPDAMHVSGIFLGKPKCHDNIRAMAPNQSTDLEDFCPQPGFPIGGQTSPYYFMLSVICQAAWFCGHAFDIFNLPLISIGYTQSEI